ncbi:MAG: hypothetical protein M3Y22_10735 [Pseudomonadota bacterium]|nr:hypothetical protein [Pseudomonadota bacterium]
MSGSTSNNYISYGSDTITLNVSEDQAEGKDAQFTVSVDGQQIGGVQAATASHSAGQDSSFTFAGNYGVGPHTVAVTFGNNLIYPGNSGDRNLYVDGVTYDGQTVSNTTSAIYNAPLFPPTSTDGNHYGNAVYTVNDTTPIPSGAGPNPTTTPGAISVGDGSDTLVLNMAEDAYQGDAQFTVSVDGQQIGGTQTTTAILNQGQSQEFDLRGTFGSGSHNVAVTFLNDQIGGFYPGTTWAIDTEDRNLYVMGASVDGGPAASGAPLELSNDGTANFTVTAGSTPSATAGSSGLFASDGAAATSDNAAISSSSLSAGSSTSGSSDGMTFVAPAATSDTATASTGSGSTDSGGSGSTIASATTTTDTTPAAAAPTTQDFTVPSATVASSSDTSGSSSGTVGNLWTPNQSAHVAGSGAHHNHHG